MHHSNLRLALLSTTLLLGACSLTGTPTDSSSSAPTYDSEITEVNTTMNLYTNRELGFSMQLPKYVKVANDMPLIEIGSLGDLNGKRVFITTMEWAPSSDHTARQDTDPNDVLNKEIQGTLAYWEMVRSNVKDDEELRLYIKERYGNDCEIGPRKPLRSGGFEVSIKQAGECMLNYQAALRYHPEKGILIAWDMGQDVRFVGEDGKAYDQTMLESFQFLD